MKDYLDSTVHSMILYECISEKIRTDSSAKGVCQTQKGREE